MRPEPMLHHGIWRSRATERFASCANVCTRSRRPPEQVRPLLTNLDSDDFSKREAAATQLRDLGDRAAGLLNDTLKASPSLETRRRVEGLLKALEGPASGETLRTLRAMTVLERIATVEAQQVLKSLSQGMSESRVTREAKASLQRLNARHRAEKR